MVKSHSETLLERKLISGSSKMNHKKKRQQIETQSKKGQISSGKAQTPYSYWWKESLKKLHVFKLVSNKRFQVLRCFVIPCTVKINRNQLFCTSTRSANHPLYAPKPYQQLQAWLSVLKRRQTPHWSANGSIFCHSFITSWGIRSWIFLSWPRKRKLCSRRWVMLPSCIA